MINTVENTPVDINLMSYINVTGWRAEFGKAIKDRCSGGFIYSRGVVLEKSLYDIEYTIESVSGGNFSVYFGGSLVANHAFAGTFSFQKMANVSEIKIFGGVGVSGVVSKFTYKRRVVDNDPEENVTIAFSEPIDKWASFYSFLPDYGFSLKRNLFTLKNGNLYMHDVRFARNTFYGVEYDTRVEFAVNMPLNTINNFKSIEIQSNKLLVTTEDGIKTSLGQVSDLFEEDFKRYELNDGVVSVDVYDREGVYFANFLRDKNTDIIEGDRLKGDLMTVELTTTNDKNFRLFRVYVNMDASMAGI